MTIRECAIVETYTGVAMLTGENCKYSYAYMEELMGDLYILMSSPTKKS